MSDADILKLLSEGNYLGVDTVICILAGTVLGIVLGFKAYSLGGEKGIKFFKVIYVISGLIMLFFPTTFKIDNFVDGFDSELGKILSLFTGMIFIIPLLVLLNIVIKLLIKVTVGCLIGLTVANIIHIIDWIAKR